MAGRTMERREYDYISGNLAYDYDYAEREERRAERARRKAEAERPAHPQSRAAQQQRRRESQRIAPLTLVGFGAVAAMLIVMLLNYAALTSLSSDIVAINKQIAAAEEEQTHLQTRYEQAFDVSRIRAAAEEAGMAKPSPSQVFYIDLSQPDSVVVYDQGENTVFSRIFTSLGRGVGSVVEYFK